MSTGPRRALLGAVIIVAVAATAAAQPYRDASLPTDARVADLLDRMTLEEKFWQLFMLAGGLDAGPERYTEGAFGFQLGGACQGADPAACANAIQRHFVEDTRLGIPVILFEEALHGLVRPGATVFPQAIGLAATFDRDLVGEVAGAIAAECRAHGIRQALSPVVNLATDVRWGRTEETYGEDPLLAAVMGAAFCAAFTRRGVITTPKHFVANVGAGGRDSYPITISERRLRASHLPPFAACIARGGARSVMTAYNSYDGTPCTANAQLMGEVLRGDLGFTGFVISDAGAVGGANVLHGTARDYADATAQALAAGLDVIFQTDPDHRELFFPAFAEGLIAPETVDRAVARVLRAKFELGLFERPYVAAADALTAATLAGHRALARRAARASLVLLKNDGGALPLRSGLARIAVLGPDAAAARLGGYSGPGNAPVSILAGIQAAAGAANRVVHAEGCPRTETGPVTVGAEFLSCEVAGRRRPGLLGEYFDGLDPAGEPALTRVDPRIDVQWTLASPDPERLRRDRYAVRWSGELRAPSSGRVRLGLAGDDGFRLYLDGALLLDRWRKVTAGTWLTEVELEAGRRYDLRVEFHEARGGARLRLVWDHGAAAEAAAQDAALEQAVALAAGSEAAVVVAGIEEGEFRDRASLALPGRQRELIRRVAATGTPTVVVLVGGSAVTGDGWLDAVPAVLQAWYPGEAGGEAVAAVLLGTAGPGGRLPIGFPAAVGQLPLAYDHAPSGRGDDYLDLTGRARFPFGHGLSYTRFAYADLRLEPATIAPGDSATVRVTLQNVGGSAGDEVVQLYLRDELATVARPLLQLADFQRVHLAPGESRELELVIGPERLTLLDRELRPVIEPGAFRVLVGASSRDIRLQGTLTVAR